MEYPQDGELTSQFASVCITNTPDTIMDIPPNFESIPPELILNIFEFVPEAICELRLTSHELKALADEFVRQRPTICIVNKININDHYYRYDDKEVPGTMRIWLEVPIRTASLFELRVKWLGVNQTAHMKRNANEVHRTFTYGLSLKMPVANDPNTAAFRHRQILREGNVSGKELLFNDHYNAEFLLELSTYVRSLHIRGYFAINAQWAPLITEMLSRKLDTLYMNHWRDQILSRDDADRLIAHLPFIGKKVWFKVGFALNTVGRSNKINGHIIHETCPARKTNKPAKDRALCIIHKSRLKEVSLH